MSHHSLPEPEERSAQKRRPHARTLDDDATYVLALLEEIGRVTDRLVAPIGPADWRVSHHDAMGPVAWDFAHMAQQEDTWLVQRLGGRPEARTGLNDTYDAYAHPRPTRARLPLLSREEVDDLRRHVRARTIEVLRDAPTADRDPLWRDLFLYKMIVLHEAQHGETILQHAAAFPAGGYVPSLRERRPPTPPRSTHPERLAAQFIRHPGGRVRVGSPRHTPWTYDNEWPIHEMDVQPFSLQRTPVTNGQFLSFIAAGGYLEPRWWVAEGWRHAVAEGWGAPLYWTHRGGAWWRRVFDEWVPVDPHAPVMHVSWFEADACARFLGCRLATEIEWETAATIDPTTGAKRAWPWGEADPDAAHANLDQVRWATDPVGTHPKGANPLGVEHLVGDVWEWTASTFDGYPGFEAFPYDDYSKRYFGQGQRVLRGGSWATRSLLRLGTFRNWDLPERRQIFAGFRLAADELPDWAESVVRS